MIDTRYIQFALVFTVMISCTSGSEREAVRSWTSSDGKQITASLISADSREVILKLESGREARVLLSRLSEPDRAFRIQGAS